MFDREINYNLPFSIAIWYVNYQRVDEASLLSFFVVVG
jgi:hypothetical protein